MLGTLVDVLIFVAAVAIVVTLGPGVIGLGKWKKRLTGRRDG